MGKVGEIAISVGITIVIVGLSMAFNIPQTIAANVGPMIPDKFKLGPVPQYPEAKAPAKTA